MEASPTNMPTQTVATYTCPSCSEQININSYFCEHCGKKIKEPPPSTTVGKQISIYLFALLVPPFGIIPAIRYLSQKGTKEKVIGYFTLIITFISLIIGVWITIGFLNQINSTLNSVQQLNDLNQLQQVGDLGI